MRTLWLFFLFLIGSTALAAPQCSNVNVSITTVEGVGTVYSSSDASSETDTRFFDACFERDGWFLRAPLLIVTETPGGVVVTAANAKIEAVGAAGTIKSLEVRGETTNLEGIKMRLEKSYKIDGFANSRYDVVAERGQLIGKKLTLQTAIFNKLSDAGAISERYAASTAILEDNRVTLNQLVFGSPQFGLSANLGSSNQAGVQLSGVTGLVGRNSAGSEIGFSADSALRLEDGVYRLENTTLNLFGLPIFVGRLDYDPRCPFAFPLVFGLGNGLTLGLENLLLTCDGKTRGTFAVYDLLGRATTAPFGSITALAFSVTHTDGTSSYFVGQNRTGSFSGTVNHEPLTGLTSAFSFVSGSRIETSVESLRSAEGRVGMAYNFDLPEIKPFTVRPELELGTVTESLGTVNRAFHGFVRGNLRLGVAYKIDDFTISGSWNGRLTYYFGDKWNGFNVDYIGSLSASYALKGYGSVGLVFSNTEQPIAPPFVTHDLTPATTLGINLLIAPTLPEAELGFSGVQIEDLSVGIALLYNLRTDNWTNQILNLNGSLSYYDGTIPTDHLGKPFQTPLVTFSPRASYNFIPQTGSAGLNLTYFGLSLAYTLGFDVAIPTGVIRLNFGLRLR